MKHLTTSDYPRTPAEARAIGLKSYFNGSKCKYGHVSKRSLFGNCMECNRLLMEARRDPVARKMYYEKNRDRERETNREYQRANKNSLSEKRKSYRLENPEMARMRCAEWRRENPGYGAQHRARHPEKYRVYTENRRGRRNSGELSKDIIERLFKAQRGLCACCGSSLGDDFHLDHIVPLARGGINTDDNVQLLTATCNLRKSYRDPIEYMQSLGKLL